MKKSLIASLALCSVMTLGTASAAPTFCPSAANVHYATGDFIARFDGKSGISFLSESFSHIDDGDYKWSLNAGPFETEADARANGTRAFASASLYSFFPKKQDNGSYSCYYTTNVPDVVIVASTAFIYLGNLT